MNREKLKERARIAAEKAANEPNQSGYNAAWLHGYARALAELLAETEEADA